MNDDVESLAVHRAALNSLRWADMNEGHREYYRRLVRLDRERREANPAFELEYMTFKG